MTVTASEPSISSTVKAVFQEAIDQGFVDKEPGAKVNPAKPAAARGQDNLVMESVAAGNGLGWHSETGSC
jgi:hypothetical protein